MIPAVRCHWSRLPALVAPLLVAGLLPASAAAQRDGTPPSAAHGERAARGDSYVLLSGVLGGVVGYQRIERRLLDLGHRVIVLDPYALSIDSADVSFHALARRVVAEMNARGVARATIVGHAHGGGVALRVAANAPDRVSQVFLLNVGALAGNKSGVFSSSIRLAPLITKLPGGKSYVRRKMVDGIRENSGRGTWLDDATARAYTDPLLDNISRVVSMALRLGDSEEREPLTRTVSRVRVPVTLLLGALTCPASPGREELAALEPLDSLVRTHRIAGACHFPHEEAPDVVVQHLVRAPQGGR